MGSNTRPSSLGPEMNYASFRKILLEPSTYVHPNLGEKIRTIMVDAFNLWPHLSAR